MMEKENKQAQQRVEFRLGSLCITPGAQQVLTNEDVMGALSRHCRGDWGEVGAEDRAENDLSVREGFRLLSVYRSKLGQRFWIITEADRSVTTVLLPDDAPCYLP